MNRKAFTLIELLIVVAIIAILAAIAVPNFLEAQTRSKMSRAKADMRSIVTAIEAYAVDYNKYPPASTAANWYFGYWVVSTPVAYITSVPPDIFKITNKPNNPYGVQYDFARIPDGYTGSWTAYFRGWGNPVNPFYERSSMSWELSSPGVNLIYDYYDYPPYDATNGTISRGDIMVVN
ncbi:hypothetical protein CVU37_06385 [candidate division BRC1 bacterium HGW-BRC1-1]|jgi:prepilin-type N-terminal cleavage/methylation domain-containing protein|nr:MAG: hypothetical protein CVU37_06385 [candidate division BRC1 bacterium HGW-BRC1-1]